MISGREVHTRGRACSLGALSLLMVLALACSSSLEPRSGVTLHVINGSCQSGQCDSLRILGFPGNQPNTPGGFWSVDLGVITGAQACFTLPPTATFRVIGEHSDGTRDTVTTTWTNAMPLALGALPPTWSSLQASPSTKAFVPADEAGWQVTLPAGTQATPSARCSS
ncbi:MAG TPA: hypothetical protein VFW98_09245 [Gemmatimonadaceae bacterium]|nr:hypothetical protein [Gemmatimonadaceae bacterium]